MATHPQPLTTDEFHRQYDGAKPAYEYWYGAAVQKSMPTLLHSLLQFLLMLMLDKAGWTPASETRLKIVPDAEPVPDIIAVRGKFKSGRYPTSAPELCIEILSPGDSLTKTFQKASHYIGWGTQCGWIIDPERRSAWMVSGNNNPEQVETLRIGETALELSTLFAEMDARVDLS